MVETSVLCFPVSGQEGASFLLEVSSNGSRPLDLKLIGSESTAVFQLKLRQKKIDEYKAATDHCTDEQWQQILISTFVDLKPLPDIEIRADVQSDGTLVTLSFRKNIQGITQRLGSIKLDEVDKEISPFHWCISAIASRNKVTDDLATATSKIESLEHTIKELKSQLDDFITTKDEDETQMLEKFRDLLNEKKLKIRQQHRLLAAAKVDPKKLANIAGGDDEDVHHDAEPSRSRKRKVQVKEEEGAESDDGFEQMDIDKPDGDGNAGDSAEIELGSDVEDQQQTTDDDDATASDPDTDDEPSTTARAKEKKATSPGQLTKPKAPASRQTAGPSRSTRAASQKQATGAAASNSEGGDKVPPPPRQLPFMKTKPAAPPPKPSDDDETESGEDDSEL
ncbi:hypothetical protein F4808DRAFT_239877 [Astrocystis sublimbata]|nr:hypothetical protein F4808DRAFT_239877 [Astrocystis sublimbata]